MSVEAHGLGTPRNGLPQPGRYVYGQSTARRRRRAEALAREAERRYARLRLLDDLSGGPDTGPDEQTWREIQQETADAPPAVLELARPEPAPAPPAGIDPERYRRRDIPASCTCKWKWIAGLGRWNRVRNGRGCPWHTGGAA